MIQDLVLQALSGVGNGMIIFVAAIGLTLVFSICNILNLSHGSMYMFGSFCAYGVFTLLNGMQGGFWVSLIMAPIICAGVGLLIELLVLRSSYKLEFIYQFILTFALMYIIQDSIKFIWGVSQFGMVDMPGILTGSVLILGRQFPIYYLFTIVFGLAIYAALAITMAKTKLGTIIRAVSADREMVGALGENVPLIITGVFMAGSFLAGLGGALVLPISVAHLGMDMPALLNTLIVIVVGGFGSFKGAFVASILLGLINAFGVWYVPTFSMALPFALLVVVLVVRPWGLFGKPIQERG